MKFVVMVTASRGWRHRSRVLQTLERIEQDLNGRDMKLIHGDANGGDTIAAQAARRLGWEIEAFPADWDRHKKKAGILRNIQMLDTNPNMVIAFWDGSSKGCHHAFTEALKRGIPTDIYVRQK